MEGYYGSGSWRRPPPPLAANISCNLDLTPSNSDASSLTADNCKDVYRLSDDVKPQDDCIGWTDEKHNLFLHHLELSFVEQLCQLKSSLRQRSEQHYRGENLWQRGTINDFEQIGRRQKISRARGQLPAEGTGQNFSDDDHQSPSDFESHAKRSKTALRIVHAIKLCHPGNIQTADYSVILHVEKNHHIVDLPRKPC